MRGDTIDYAWYAVITPSVFREHRLPIAPTERNRDEARKMRQLEQLAEIHRTSIERTSYRRG